MTKQQYSDYQRSVKHGLKGLSFVSTGACPGCLDCGIGEHSSEKERAIAEEPSFSWRQCECCRSSLGGDRHPAHGRDTNDQIVHLTICTDCLYYINYGKLDDLTMMEIEKV